MNYNTKIEVDLIHLISFMDLIRVSFFNFSPMNYNTKIEVDLIPFIQYQAYFNISPNTLWKVPVP